MAVNQKPEKRGRKTGVGTGTGWMKEWGTKGSMRWISYL
jgi:hypothetical protein